MKSEANKMKDDSSIKKLEDLTGKLPIMEIENAEYLKSTNKIKVINEILEIFRNNSEDKAYGKILKCVLSMMDSHYGIFGYIDDEESFVCPSLTMTVWDKCKMEGKTKIFPRNTWGESIWGQSIIEKKTLYSNKPFKVPEGHIDIRKAMMVPIIYNEKVIGLFEIANKETDYTKDDQEMLEQIARLMSPILMARLERDGVYKGSW